MKFDKKKIILIMIIILYILFILISCSTDYEQKIREVINEINQIEKSDKWYNQYFNNLKFKGLKLALLMLETEQVIHAIVFNNFILE